MGFIKAYIQKFKFSTVTSTSFKTFFCEYFSSNAHMDTQIDIFGDEFWRRALHCTGMPSDLFVELFDNELSLVVEQAALAWTRDDNTDAYDISTWSSQQKCIFLERLIDSSKSKALSTEVLSSIDEKFRFTETRNAEVKFRWLSLCLQCGSLFIVPHVVAFLTQQGRMKFVRPLFRMLHKADSKIASSTFANNLNFYHPIARKLIESDIKG